MSIPLAVPHFPTAAVAAVVMDASDPLLCAGVSAYGVRILPVMPDRRLAVPLSCHADMLCHHTGGAKIFLAPGQEELSVLLKDSGMQPAFIKASTLSGTYPADVPLNGARIGSFLVGNPDTLSREIQDDAQRLGLTLLPVRQGYTKCVLCMVTPSAVITEDRGVAAACTHAGFAVLQIAAGSVRLTGYPYGFLGGACGFLAPGKLAFCGDLDTHSDACRIRRFLEYHGVQAVSLRSGPLYDIGGILPVTQHRRASKSQPHTGFCF